MLFTYTGNNTFFLEQSFFDQTGALSVEITSVSETQLVLTHTVFTSANVTVVFKGQGFSVDANGLATSGTITSIEFNGLDIRQATISDINWEAEAFQNALFAVEATSDLTGIAALFNSSGPITIDASNGLTGFDQELTWSNLIPLINQPITFIGSPFDDSVAGASGDDMIDTRSSTSNGDRIAGSEGDDRIIFDLPENSDSPGYYLDYDSIETGMRFDIDGVTNTGSATGPGFVDTFENVQDALGSYLGIEGTNHDDTFDVRLGPDQVYSFIGGAGSDTYNLDVEDGRPIFDFFFGDVISGIDLNFATGVIANDGFGFTETLDIDGTPINIILLATDQDDRATDGAGDQLIRFYEGDDVFVATNLGDDSIDGGNGTDTAIFEEFSQGEATLTFDGFITTVTDRGAPGGSTSLLSVERLETRGDAPLELAKHDGIGLISAADLTALTELYIAYFDRAADALGLSFWATAFQKNGFSLREIADQFFTQPETQALYSGVSDGDFVTAVYNNVLGRDPDTAGFEFWTGQLSAGNVSESGFILELLAGACAQTGDPADVAYIEAKTDIGLYFAVTQGQNNLDDARAVMDTFNGSENSVTDAIAVADAAYQEALASTDTLLMPVVGVIESPFDGVA
jgi:hypothetical protein